MNYCLETGLVYAFIKPNIKWKKCMCLRSFRTEKRLTSKRKKCSLWLFFSVASFTFCNILFIQHFGLNWFNCWEYIKCSKIYQLLFVFSICTVYTTVNFRVCCFNCMIFTICVLVASGKPIYPRKRTNNRTQKKISNGL